ncbi:hypothetical protein FE257_000812 [Aspergillus nanangensis]|uniref:DASH complex subunit DAD2 n=1 Tax=Aspergillus nanangensis TaxID=2582783 RepID=A0AAD4CEG6_ASPNN|nr:hypothetical protein FE257_000812 [Aspergillus nanangensis]
MAYTSRPGSVVQPGSASAPGFRQPSNYSAVSSQQSSALSARIATKKAELDNLKQLRDMSSTLAMQMQALENKLGTLKDGTEAKATAIQTPMEQGTENLRSPVMPATLVRIPTEEQSYPSGS